MGEDALAATQQAFKVALSLSGEASAIDTLSRPLVQRITSHFMSDVPTNRLDKPEWCFRYVVTALTYNLELIYFLCKTVPSATALRIRSGFLTAVLGTLGHKARLDLKAVMECPSGETNALLLHYIEESMKFDYEMGETMEWREQGVMAVVGAQEGIVEKWLEIDVKFVLTQFHQEFSGDSSDETSPWRQSCISHHTFLSLSHIIALMEAVTGRYVMLADAGLRDRMMQVVSLKVVPLYFDKCEEFFQRLRRSVIAYESNAEYWADIVIRLCTLHQTLTTFQEFLFSLPTKSLFASLNTSANGVKSSITDSLLHLFDYSLAPHFNAYRLLSLKVMTEVSQEFGAMMQCIGGMQGVVLKGATESFAKYVLGRFAHALLSRLETEVKNKEGKLSEANLGQFKYDVSALRNLLIVDLEAFMP